MITKDALIRGARAALYAFVAVFGVGLLGFIQDVATWAGSTDKHFPSINPLGKLAVAALCSAATGFVGLIVNATEDKRGGNGLFGAKALPKTEPEQGGGYPEGTHVIVGEPLTADYVTKEWLEEQFADNRRKLFDSIRRLVKK